MERGYEGGEKREQKGRGHLGSCPVGEECSETAS